MMHHHLFIRIVLFSSTLFPGLFAWDPRVAARLLHRRAPEPINLSFCCLRVSDVGASDAPTDAELMSRHAAAAVGGKPWTAKPQPKPYPTQVTNPRLSEDGARLRAGAIILDNLKTKVLLIRPNDEGWRFPEGDWSWDEGHIQDAAVREAWHKAGVFVMKDDTVHVDTVVTEQSVSKFFQIDSSNARAHMDSGYPKKQKVWVGIEEAPEYLAQNHPEQLAMLTKLKPWPNGKSDSASGQEDGKEKSDALSG